MIKNIIFDFGDVFINLDKSAPSKEFTSLGDISSQKIHEINILYETAAISTSEFLTIFKKEVPRASEQQIIDAWNSILLDFPEYRLEFIHKLASLQQYTLVLLSNTNELHIDWIQKNVPFFETFQSCFEAFYLSHEIGLRKPNPAVFEFVLEQHKFNPKETLFIDDTAENTTAAQQLGIHVWNNNPKTEDITNVFTIKSHLF